ncbi:MAG: hypothetical protein H6814_11695 [Phycisphaeraceae bacterium]|nr:hypothetical protein [Phycisphaeraceae bacterium]
MSHHNRPGRVGPCKTLAAFTLIAFGAGGWSAQPASAQDDSPFDIDRADADSEVTVSEYMTVELHVQDEELSSVLQLLSLQSQRNIVVSNDVSATVTADLYGVTFYEAMDAILHVNGYGYIEQGNFIFVYTLDEIAQIEAANRTPVTRVIQLNYLNAVDAASFVEPLLSEIGQIKTNGAVGSYSIPDDSPVGDESFALSATMVVTDYAEHVDEIERLVMELDTKPAQVLVEATILQTQLTEANAFGVDFSIIGNVNFTDFINTGGPLGAANSIQAGGDGSSGGLSPADNNAYAIGSTPGGTGGASTLKLGVVQDDFAIFMRLLDEVTDFSVLSNPKVLALNRQPARVLVGRRLGYLNTTATETSTTQSVEFLDTGTQLRFRPFISKDGMIRMELNPSVSEGFIRESVDNNNAPVSIPDEVTQELTTNVIVRDGSTIVLGGLFKESTTLTRKQVPILGDIPIVGAAFRGHDDAIDRSEIIFLITPTIVNDALLAEQGDKASEFIENVRTGSRQGLLPFSREKMTAQLNIEAERLAGAGNVDGALWRLRRSLELNPMQPEVINLRERLVNERDRWPDRSLMESIVRDFDATAIHIRSAEAANRVSGEWIDPGERGPVNPEDPYTSQNNAIVSGKFGMSSDELHSELESARSRFTPADTEPSGSQATVSDDPEGEYLFEIESAHEFDAQPIEIDEQAADADGFDPDEFERHEFDPGEPRSAAEQSRPESLDQFQLTERYDSFSDDPMMREPEADFGPNIVEFFNGEPGFSTADAGAEQGSEESFDSFGQTQGEAAFGELASGEPGLVTSPYFLTFDSIFTPFASWLSDPSFQRFNENGMPIVEAPVIQEMNQLDPASPEESTYFQLTNLLDSMFEKQIEGGDTSQSEVAEVETDGDE